MPTTNVSTYGVQNGRKSIYGIRDQGSVPIFGSVSVSGPGLDYGLGPQPQPEPGCPTTCTDTLALKGLQDIIASLYGIIEESFPSTKTTASLIAKYTAPARTNAFTFVRFAWMKENPGERLYSTKMSALLIQAIYLKYGLDGSKDPLIVKFLGSPPVVTGGACAVPP